MSSLVALPHESKIYSTFSNLYDLIFTWVFFPRIRRVLEELSIPQGASVLEVGVGTGLSLPAYPQHCRVTAIDLAPDMLERAHRKCQDGGLSQIELKVGDAQNLEFESDHFDYVTSFHVISVVPDANRMLAEMIRVCRPGGTLVLINHFRSPRRWLARLIDRIDPITRHLGWRTTLSLEALLQKGELEVVSRYKTSPRSLFTILIARRPALAARAYAAGQG